jgi:hypothetical protein
MANHGTASADHDLRALAARFAHWRRIRATPRERIPAALWEQAVAVSAVLPPSRVARTLRLSRGALKAHRSATGNVRTLSSAPPATQGFVEVTAPPPWPGEPSSVEVEVRRPDGSQLRMHFREAVLPLAAVVRAFLGEA